MITTKKIEITIKVRHITDEDGPNPRRPTIRRVTMEATPGDVLDIERCQQIGAEEIGITIRSERQLGERTETWP